MKNHCNLLYNIFWLSILKANNKNRENKNPAKISRYTVIHLNVSSNKKILIRQIYNL